MTTDDPTSISSVLDDPFIHFLQDLSSESDRGVAVLAFARLSDELTGAIKAHFRNKRRTMDELFSGAGPLNSFAARAKLAYCLGVYDSKLLDDLTVIDRIRNVFAHHQNRVTFQSPEIAALIAKIHILETVGGRRGLLNAAELDQEEPKQPRHLYLRAVLLIAGVLNAEATMIANQPRAPRLFGQ